MKTTVAVLILVAVGSACGGGPLAPTYVAPPGYDPNKPIVIPAGCHLDPWPPPPRLPFAYKLVCDE